jgi:hypothetical protein
MATDSKKVRRDAFIKSVRPDLKSTEELVLLKGYIGGSNLAGNICVYFDPVLSDCIELAEQDVLYCEPVKPEEDPLGGSRLWVKKTTVFTAGDPRHANRIESTFLVGDLVRAFRNLGKKIPAAVAKEVPINSYFIEGGCGPVTLKFEDCAPTAINDPFCQLLEPPPPPSVQASWCNSTCPRNPCNPSWLRGCVSGRYQDFCVVESVRCLNPVKEAMVVNPMAQGHYGYGTYTGGFDPYKTANYGY